MANNKLSEGVGKKIVEALKQQSEVEINAIPSSEAQESAEDFASLDFSTGELDVEVQPEVGMEEDSFLDDLTLNEEQPEVESASEDEPILTQKPAAQPFAKPSAGIADNFVNELDNFEVPSNIAVLKKLITQLPSGVTKHTGAQIIRQTMEALGISMKSVLQEAQQLQESLNSSAKECHNSIQEYKKHILALEKQAQNHQRQYAALNELISLFVQTTR